MRFCTLLVAVFGTLGFAQTTQPSFTVDDLIAQHRSGPITPTWAPDGQSFLYEADGAVELYQLSESKRHEWFRPEELERRAADVVRPQEFSWQNRRVSSDSYQWFPNSKDLLVAAGGDLFVVHPNGKFDQITHTEIDEEDPHLSPDGTKVLYRWKSNLYVRDLNTHAVKQLTSDGTPTLLNGELDWVYPEELDLGTAAWWSPDSKHVAFLQFDVSHEFVYPQVDLTRERALSEPERYPQAGTPNADVKLGVLSIATGETKWMQIGPTTDALIARIAWLPDSSRVAVERLNRVQDKLDLLFANVSTGAVSSVLKEESKTWINVAQEPLFLKSRDEFLWTSERSGFRHVYRYRDDGELLGQLTKGEWEVVAISAIDEKSGTLYYTSSETSPLETQLYRVPLAGGEAIRLTKEEGSHAISMNEQGNAYVDTYSSLHQPGQTVLAHTNETSATVLRGPEKPNSALLPEEIVTMKTSDGTTLYGRLIKPVGFQPGTRYPLIVSVYGGPGVQSVRNRWYGASWEQVLAHAGYLVWQLDNRGSKGRGLAFEAPIYRKMGVQEVADQRAGVGYLVERGLADSKRVGITGFSYGGYMTLRSLLFAPEVFQVGVAGAPVTDWHNYDTIYTERYMGVPEANPAAYDASSNTKNAERLAGKLLIIHNMEDDNVLFQNTMQMASALERAGKPFLMQIYPQKTHGITGPYRKEFYQQMLTFFDEHLKR